MNSFLKALTVFIHLFTYSDIFRSIGKKAEGKTRSAEGEGESDKERNQANDDSSKIKIPYLKKKRRYKQVTKEFSGQVILSLIIIFVVLHVIYRKVFKGQ